MDVNIEKKDKAVILLNSLSDEEYETFILILINEKQSLKYNDVSVVLVNYEVRRKDKQSSFSSTSAEVLVVRGKGSNQKGKGVRKIKVQTRVQRSVEPVYLLQRTRALEG